MTATGPCPSRALTKAFEKVFSPFQQVMTQKGKDQGLHRSIFKQADASPARIEIARLRVEGQTKIRIVPAPDHSVKIIGGAGFLHSFDDTSAWR